MKRIVCFVFAAAVLLALCACGYQADAVTTAVPVTAVPVTVAPTATPTEAPTPTPESTAVSVTLYHGDDNAEHIIPENCIIPAATPQAIADKLCELGVFNDSITVNSCEMGNVNILRLDMGADFAKQVQSMGTAGEYIMLGSLVNSFISVYAADGVMLTVNGEPLETGHEIYDQTLIFYAD